MKITIQPIAASGMRYKTVGDWIFMPGSGDLFITVAATGNDYYDFLVGLHEAIEAMICRQMGVKEEAVTAWDLAHPEAEEPGALLGAPYFYAHLCASQAEESVAHMMGLDWSKYEEAVDAVESKVGRNPSPEPNKSEPGLAVG